MHIVSLEHMRKLDQKQSVLFSIHDGIRSSGKHT